MSGRRYEVQQTIGVGGMGTVYRARLLSSGDFAKGVALKVLHRDLPDRADIARRLRDEARILGLIRHRAVVHVDGLVSLDGCWTVVMELIDGLDLKQVLERLGALPETCALELIGEVAGALHVAFQSPGPDGRELRLLHRDIKPANLQITTTGEVKILDFGVARADFATREAQTQQLAFGSLGYVAQERIDGVDVPAGDVYSLGVVLYEALSGERFGQTFLHAKRHEARLNERDAALASRGVSPGTRALLREMLSFTHDARPNARDVEKRATQLRTQVKGPSLRDWAEGALGAAKVAAEAAIEEGELVGRTLYEGVEAASPEPLLPSPPRRPPSRPVSWSVRVAIALTLILMLALAAVVVVAAGLGGVVAGSLFF